MPTRIDTSMYHILATDCQIQLLNPERRNGHDMGSSPACRREQFLPPIPGAVRRFHQYRNAARCQRPLQFRKTGDKSARPPGQAQPFERPARQQPLNRFRQTGGNPEPLSQSTGKHILLRRPFNHFPAA